MDDECAENQPAGRRGSEGAPRSHPAPSPTQPAPALELACPRPRFNQTKPAPALDSLRVPAPALQQVNGMSAEGNPAEVLANAAPKAHPNHDPNTHTP